MKTGSKEIQFENAPLKEAVVEIKFQPELSIENKRDLFHKKVRKKFPNLLIPAAKDGESHLKIPFKYLNEDETKQILSSITSFAFSTKDYSTFSNYKAEVLPLLKTFCDMYDIKRIIRIGLRYINHIYVEPDFKISDYFKFDFNAPKFLKEGIKEFDFSITKELGKGNLRILIKSQSTNLFIDKTQIPAEILKDISKLTNYEMNYIILDFDYYIRDENLSVSKVDEYLDYSHTQTKKIFLDLLSDKYRESLKEIESVRE